MDFSEKWGNDVEAAVELALKDLKLSIDEVNVVVLEEPLKGFLGIGSKLAKVRVERKSAVEETKEEPIENTNKTEKKAVAKADLAETREIKKAEKETSIALEKPLDLVPVTENEGITFLKELSHKMGLEIEIKAEGNKDCIYIQIEGNGTGTIIGKRGQTLDAIQYLTSLVVNKNEKDYVRVVVDAENYREKREKTLEALANKLAEKAIKTRRSVKLEPMNPYERKVIHATLSNNEKIITKSTGEEPYRRVIITVK